MEICSPRRRVGERAGMGKSTTVKLIVVLVLAVLLVVLIVQNTTTVQVQLLFWTITGSVALLVSVVGALGFLLGVMVVELRSGRSGKANCGRK